MDARMTLAAVRDPHRLRALRATRLLDTPPESAFDRITGLVTRILRVPVSLVSLVDEDRQFFKSCVGLSEPWSSDRETPLTHSFCQHVVASAQPLVIEDARSHPELRDNLAIPDLGVVAYAGIPLVMADGAVLGSLCAIDTRPRQWNDEDIAILSDLADSVMTEVSLRTEAREHVRLAAALAESEAQLVEAQRVARVGSWSWDVESGRMQWSDELRRLLEARQLPREPTVMHLLEAVHPEDRPGLQADLREALGGGAPLQAEFRSPAGEAGQRILHLRGEVRRAGGRLGAFGTVQDVTERRRAEEEIQIARAFSAAVLDTADALIMVMDTAGGIVEFNRACERLTGWAAEEMRGRHFTMLLDAVEVPAVTATFGDLVAGRHRARYEADWLTRDGRRRRVVWSNTAIATPTGEVTHVVATGHDVTEQREMERLKDEFAALVSHELRTPLTSIRAALGLLTSGTLGALEDPRARRMLEMAAQNAERLTRLTNDILTLERLESGTDPLSLEDVSDAALLQMGVEGVQGLADQAGVRLSARPAGIQLVADPDRVAQVLVNLIGNAVKFSPAGGEVLLTTEEGADAVVFSVRDQGRGIPPEKLATIFGRFQQVDASDARVKGGAGLGLAICKSIVERHGGRIWAESQPGEGSTLRFTLPRSPGSGDAPA